MTSGSRLILPSPKAAQRLLIPSDDVSRAIRKLRGSDPSVRVADNS